jgi:hypothetical protein
MFLQHCQESATSPFSRYDHGIFRPLTFLQIGAAVSAPHQTRQAYWHTSSVLPLLYVSNLYFLVLYSTFASLIRQLGASS